MELGGIMTTVLAIVMALALITFAGCTVGIVVMVLREAE